MSAHPLDPLTPEELAQVVDVVRRERELGSRVRFIRVDLEEPAKLELAGDSTPHRRAIVVILDNDAGEAYEGIVDLEDGSIERWTTLEGVQPAISADEFVEAAEAVRADPDYREALARRGISGDAIDSVHIEPWSVGSFETSERRLARALSWVRSSDDDVNPYARPIGRLVAVVDLNEMTVVRVDDHGVVPIPPEDADYRDGAGGPYRADQKPLEIVQPDGPSFVLDGRELRWQKWRMRVGFANREGLVLHQIAYEDEGELRSVCHRASIAELVIPYGDPSPTMHFKNVFDIGEYGLGPLINELELGCDCLGEIRYLDSSFVDTKGNVQVLRNAICIHEEDYGILWKHRDDRTARHDVARSRRLVVSCVATVGNYEYGFYWLFYQDGTIEFEGKLTGIMHTAGVPVGAPGQHATEVAPGVAAGYHQHFLTARLDMDVDGTDNVPVETEAAPVPAGPANEDGSAFISDRRVLGSESAAKRMVSPLTARRWRVESSRRRNRMGGPTAFELVPGETVAAMAHPDSQFRKRAGFLDHSLWVTPYSPDERYPAGDYPNQHAGGDGLPRWTAADRPLEDEDVVLWYTFGAHHVPRLEDWPVMPVAYCGFHLRPVGFFDRSPALDVPPPPAAHCEHG
jgi:primary-amine oxidase